VKSGDRGRQIEQVAAELFFTEGYHGTGLREIARAVGIQPASLYHHFANKQELLFSILAHTIDDLLTSADAVFASEPDPRGQLAGLVRSFIQLVSTRQREGAVGDIELRSLEPGNRATLIEKRDRYQRCFEDVIERGVAEGIFSAADAKLSTYAILGMCNHISLWYRATGPRPIDDVATAYVEFALRLVGDKAAADAAG
jgi:TetR/AcrR family transcriptional regulator, cholesterol catabolism regulator